MGLAELEEQVVLGLLQLLYAGLLPRRGEREEHLLVVEQVAAVLVHFMELEEQAEQLIQIVMLAQAEVDGAVLAALGKTMGIAVVAEVGYLPEGLRIPYQVVVAVVAVLLAPVVEQLQHLRAMEAVQTEGWQLFNLELPLL